LSYNSIEELPKSVRNLPKQAKAIYLKAFNSAWEENGDDSGTESRDSAAHEAAWSAVRQEYEKDEDTGEWRKIGDAASKSRRPIRHRRR
jgi:cation transport regulator